MAALSCMNLARQAAAAHPDAPKLQSFRIERSTLDPRILRIMGRIKVGDRYGDVFSDDAIREFLASNRGDNNTPDGEAILVTETEIRAFASQRPHDTLIPVPATDYFADHQQTAQGLNAGAPVARSSSVAETGRTKEGDQAQVPAPETFGPASLIEADGALQTSPRLAADADKTISQVWDAYSEAMVTDGRWKEDQGKQAMASLRLIIGVVGDVKVSALGIAKCNNIKREFLRLPIYYAKKPKWVAISKRDGLIAVAHAFQAEVTRGVASVQPVTVSPRHQVLL